MSFDGPSTYGYKDSRRIIGVCEVVNSDGLSGFGEIYAASYLPPEFANSIVQLLATNISAMKLNFPSDFYQDFTIPFISNGGIIETFLGGIDIAIWDLFLKHNQATLSEFLGFKVLNQPKLYFSSGSNFMSATEIAVECKNLGSLFDGYKLRVSLNELDDDLSRVSAAAENLKPGVNLMVDAIMSTNPRPWDLSKARRMIKLFSDFSPLWIEEPLHPKNLVGYAELTEDYPNLIACGEALVSEIEFRAFEGLTKLGFIQLDATQNGGLTKTLEVLNRLSLGNHNVAMHIWGSKLSFNLNYQVARLYNFISWVEYPGYILDTDFTFGNSHEQEDMIGFSNLNSSLLKDLKHSWSGDHGVYKI